MANTYQDKVNELRLLLDEQRRKNLILEQKLKALDITAHDKLHCPVCGKMKDVEWHEGGPTGFKRFYFIDCCGMWAIKPRKQKPYVVKKGA